MQDNKVLNKYKNVKVHAYDAFSIVPKEVFNSGLSNPEIGMYVLLAANSGPNALYEGRSVFSTSYTGIMLRLNWKCRRADIKNLLDQLAEKKLIHIKDLGRGNLDILFKKQDEFESDFVKIYGAAIRKILVNATGARALTRLAFYAGFRCGIFENSTASKIFDKSPNYIAASMGGLSADVVRHNLKWLREHNIIAYYKCKVTPMLGHERYYYAEYKDYKLLTSVVTGYMQQHYVSEVLA